MRVGRPLCCNGSALSTTRKADALESMIASSPLSIRRIATAVHRRVPIGACEGDRDVRRNSLNRPDVDTFVQAGAAAISKGASDHGCLEVLALARGGDDRHSAPISCHVDPRLRACKSAIELEASRRRAGVAFRASIHNPSRIDGGRGADRLGMINRDGQAPPTHRASTNAACIRCPCGCLGFDGSNRRSIGRDFDIGTASACLLAGVLTIIVLVA